MLSVWGDVSQSRAKISNGVNYFVMSSANKPKCTTVVMLVNNQLHSAKHTEQRDKKTQDRL